MYTTTPTVCILGIPRILEGTLPSHLQDLKGNDDEWRPFAHYMQTARINVNVRQVFPKGFRPDIAVAN